MTLGNVKLVLFSLAGFFHLVLGGVPISSAQQSSEPAFHELGSKRPFTVADDIGLTRFADYGNGGNSVVLYSPDGRYFDVLTEKPLLDPNVTEDTIWLFRTSDVQRQLQQPASAAPAPLRLVHITDIYGPVIGNVKWLPDSRGIAFTATKRDQKCKFNQLYWADIRTGAIHALTPDDQNVENFDIRSENAFVYSVSAPKLLKPREEDVAVLTGKSIYDAIFPEDPGHMQDLAPFNEAGLWMVRDGKRSRVLDTQAFPSNSRSLSLSPDGSSVVAILETVGPPEDWARYKDVPINEEARWPLDPLAYYLIDLKKRSKRLLFNAPCGCGHSWWTRTTGEIARWSADGRSLVLSNTYFPLDVSDPNERLERESHPNMAVLRLDTGLLSILLPVRGSIDQQGNIVGDRYAINDLRFINDNTVVVDYDRSTFNRDDPPSAVFNQGDDGKWKQVPGLADPILASLPVRVESREAINQPPQIVAAPEPYGDFRVIWDPNPQLKGVELGEAVVIHGKDVNGLEWEAGLVKPPDYDSGKRYPLVIQTHGFRADKFLSNGAFRSAPFAARALAAKGIMVVQAGGNDLHLATAKEAPENVAVYQSIVKTLTDEGLVDPKRVGAIGFSRTGYHLLHAMVASPSLLAAVSVTDVSTGGYFEYIFSAGREPESTWEKMYGGSPFTEEGMKNWLAASPEFTMDKVKAPLLLVQPGTLALLFDLEPYAVLRYLHKPVELLMLPADTHPITGARQRFNCETINVDWFRFWLKGEEDPDPAKKEQYVRWRELRKLQEQNDAKAKAAAN